MAIRTRQCLRSRSCCRSFGFAFRTPQVERERGVVQLAYLRASESETKDDDDRQEQDGNRQQRQMNIDDAHSNGDNDKCGEHTEQIRMMRGSNWVERMHRTDATRRTYEKR